MIADLKQFINKRQLSNDCPIKYTFKTLKKYQRIYEGWKISKINKKSKEGNNDIEVINESTRNYKKSI